MSLLIKASADCPYAWVAAAIVASAVSPTFWQVLIGFIIRLLDVAFRKLNLNQMCYKSAARLLRSGYNGPAVCVTLAETDNLTRSTGEIDGVLPLRNVVIAGRTSVEPAAE